MPLRFSLRTKLFHRGLEGHKITPDHSSEDTAMNEDRIAGTARNVGGKVQEGFGRVTGDAKSQADGLVNQAAGAAQDFYGQAKETASDAAQVVRQGAIDTEDCPPYHRTTSIHHGFRSALCRLVYRSHATAGIETCR
jgi:uncharacterized protein YjbJ (UPF0337 family)